MGEDGQDRRAEVEGDLRQRPARWFAVRGDGKVACLLCPHACVLAPGRNGTCGVRRARPDGSGMEIPWYGMASSIAIDPIEKKPLYHFHPGSRILSVGFLGCSLRCPFCQNWEISQGTDARARFVSPRALVEAAAGTLGIAYTYSEPLIHGEYLLDAASLARAAGMKNVLVSNGYLQPGPAEEILSLMDAANIDLKTWDAEAYRGQLGGGLEEVKRFIGLAAGKVHLEVTTLVVPGVSESREQVESISRFIASLSPDIPLHLSAYYPQYKFDEPPTRPASVRDLADAAREHLRYVYTGNLGAEESVTSCLSCGAALVRRVGYSVTTKGLAGAACRACGAKSPVVA